MIALPQSPFRSAAARVVSVPPRALVQMEGASYSVPCGWAGLELAAYLGPSAVEIVGPDGRVTHPRLRFGQRSIHYRRYLPELAHKPQAVRQVANRLVPELGEPFVTLWRRLVDAHGPREAARHFARVLEAIVRRGERPVATRVGRALVHDTPLGLALADDASDRATVDIDRLPPSIHGIDVAPPCVHDYDALLEIVP